MTTATAFSAISAHLIAEWTTTPLAWENVAFNAASQAPYVMVQMVGRIWDQASIGAGDRLQNRWREEGDLLLSVIVPTGTGSLTARTHAEALANIFRGLQLGDIEFGDIHIDDGAIAEDRGARWLLPVRINWIRG